MSKTRNLRPNLRRASRSEASLGPNRPHTDASPWVRSALHKLGPLPTGVALDIPCGRGRHTRMLAELGFLVVAADLDEQALRETMANAPPKGAIIPVRLDAQRPLPFRPCSIDLLLIVHAHSLEVLSRSLGCLRPGGYL